MIFLLNVYNNFIYLHFLIFCHKDFKILHFAFIYFKLTPLILRFNYLVVLEYYCIMILCRKLYSHHFIFTKNLFIFDLLEDLGYFKKFLVQIFTTYSSPFYHYYFHLFLNSFFSFCPFCYYFKILLYSLPCFDFDDLKIRINFNHFFSLWILFSNCNNN
jgi:hypothetical protein